jgi:hypothetical protein
MSATQLASIQIAADRLAASATPLSYQRIVEAARECGVLPSAILIRVDNIRKAKEEAKKAVKR